MKKQYRYYEAIQFKYNVELYHDGKLIKIYRIWADEIDAEVERIESRGYTFGYTQDEVDRVKKRYEVISANLIT